MKQHIRLHFATKHNAPKECCINSKIHILCFAPPHAKPSNAESWTAVMGSVIESKVDVKPVKIKFRITAVYMIALMLWFAG